MAEGSARYCAISSLESGSASGLNLKGMVPSRPVVVVAAWLIFEALRRGSRKVDVQPAPRIRRSTLDGELAGFGCDCYGDVRASRVKSENGRTYGHYECHCKSVSVEIELTLAVCIS